MAKLPCVIRHDHLGTRLGLVTVLRRSHSRPRWRNEIGDRHKTVTSPHRFIIDGELLDVETSGKYRGYLFVRKRRYLPGPDYGTDYPLYYISPDGKRSVMIPNSAE